MKEPVELRDDVARALGMLGQASPPEGMEARILGRMRERQAEVSGRSAAGRSSLQMRWTFASAIAVAAIVLGVLSWHQARPVRPAQLAVKMPRLEGPSSRVATGAADVPANITLVRRRVYVAHARVLQTQVSAPSQIPPPLPLTQQEHLLLALAQTPRLVSALAFVTTSETIADHGLGRNAIFELDHQELAPLKTTLLLTPLQTTLPQPNLSGDTE